VTEPRPTDQEAARADHSNRARLRGHGYFKRLGPGLVTGAADDDPSGIGTYSQVGASLRFDLLWTTVVSLPLAAGVLEVAGRLGLTTGRGLAALVRERFRRPVLYFVVFLVVGANTFNIGADLGSMAASLRLLVPVPSVAGIFGFAIVMTVLQVTVPYVRYARLLRWLAFSLVAYVGVLAVVKVPWGEVLHHTFLPSFNGDKQHLEALIAIFGTTISPYLFFWQTAEEVEEAAKTDEGGHSHEGDRSTGDDEVTVDQMRRMRIDVIAGISAGVFVMFAILVSAAVTLGAHGVTHIQTADQAAQALKPIAGRFAGLLFTLGIVGTGLLAVPVLAGSTAYALSEAFHLREGLSRTLRQAPGFYAVIVAAMGVGIALNFIGINPIRALVLSALLNGLAAPPILLLMLLLSRCPVVGEHRAGWLSNSLLATAALVMTALPVWYLLA
jgi:NRAMP (natural resistance-associated macrophage protein)-like metal ion transporter